MPLEALILDVDGTLAETERHGHRVAFNRAFREAGLDWNWDEGLYGELLEVTGGRERMRHFIERCAPAFPLSGQTRNTLLDTLQTLKTRHYAALIRSGAIAARPGVLRLLRQARAAGLRLAIATTTARTNVETLLASSFPDGARDWFEVIAAADSAPLKKPAPDIYEFVLEHMRLPALRTLAIEDSAQGLAAAHAAGLPTLVTLSDYTRDHNVSSAELVVDQLGEPDEPLTTVHDPFALAPKGLIDLGTLTALHEAWLARRTVH